MSRRERGKSFTAVSEAGAEYRVHATRELIQIESRGALGRGRKHSWSFFSSNGDPVRLEADGTYTLDPAFKNVRIMAVDDDSQPD